MYDLSRDPAIGRLAAELLVHLRASRRNATAEPSAPPTAAPSIWQKAPAILDLARKITLNVVVILVGGILIAVTVKAAIQPQFVFESIRLPTELANSGYGSNVLADRVLDRVHAINQQTSKELMSLITPRTDTVTERMFIGTTPQYAALSSIQVPSSSLNLQSVVLLLRDLFKPDDIRVTGDLTIVSQKKADDRVAAAVIGKGHEIVPSQAPSTYVLQLRSVRGDLRQARTVTATDFDQLIAKTAEALLDLSDPHILASYHYGKRAWNSVDEILDRALEDGAAAGDVKWALTLRGQRLLDLNRSAEASRYFEQVVQLGAKLSGYDAVSPSKNRERAIAHTNWGNALQKGGDSENAVRQYKRALEIDPTYALALYNWGNALETVRDYEGAIDKYKRAAAIAPGNAAIFNSWGTVLRKMGDPEGAIAKYKHALELNPKFTLAYNNWGLALRAKGDPDGAIDKYKRAIAIDPKYAVAYNSWGLALRAKGDDDGAIDKYKRATDVDPNYAVAYNSWGVVLAAKKDDAGAIEMYKRAVAADPQYAPPVYNWGNALRRLGDGDGAIERYKQALAINPRYVLPLNNWGTILQSRKDYAGAIEKYEAATDIDPTHVRSFKNWANALEALGRDDEAAALRERIEEIEAEQKPAPPANSPDAGAVATK
jgi:tetratricopeptide (TPR) repeat protein